MKKIMSVVLLGLLLMSIIPLGLAQEDTEETELELEQEAQIMSTLEGAQYRLDQLALSLENQIEHAKDILSELELSEEIMDELNGYVVDMELLLERVQAIELSGTASEMAAEFVAIKREAISLTQSFRRTLTSSINQQKIEQVRERVKEMKELRLEEFKAQLEEKKQNMYMNRLNEVLETIGEDASDILEQLENGDITAEEARELIREKINAMSQEKHAELRAEIKKQADDARENFQARKEEAKAKFEAKRAEIKANADARREQLKARFQASLEQRKANAQAIREQFKVNLEARKLAANKPVTNTGNQNN